MPRYSGVTFNVQPVEKQGKVSGYVVSGFLSKAQLSALPDMVDNVDTKGYKRSARWRGEFGEMAKAMIEAVNKALAQG